MGICMASYFTNSSVPIVCCATVVLICINNTDYKLESDVRYRVRTNERTNITMPSKSRFSEKLLPRKYEILTKQQMRVQHAKVMFSIFFSCYRLPYAHECLDVFWINYLVELQFCSLHINTLAQYEAVGCIE